MSTLHYRCLHIKGLSLCIYEQEILKARRWFLFLGTLAFLAPVVSVAFCVLLDKPNAWIPRGGAVMAGLAFLADTKANSMSDVFKSNGYAGQDFVALQEKYSAQVSWCRVFSQALIVIGTAVWGFGDLLPIGLK